MFKNQYIKSSSSSLDHQEPAMAATTTTKSNSSNLIIRSSSSFLILPSILAFMGTIFIFYYTYSTTYLITSQHQYTLFHSQFTKKTTSPVLEILKESPPIKHMVNSSNVLHQFSPPPPVPASDRGPGGGGRKLPQQQQPMIMNTRKNGYNISKKSILNYRGNTDIYHDREIFMENYKQMNKTMKIYIYPHKRNDPFANVLLPEASDPGGNYASESYFKKALAKSHFVTRDPSKADLFFLPFSITNMRNDKRIGVGGIPNFVRDYVYNVSHAYPYWNRSGGADHFYVACHSIGKIAMDKAEEVKINAIQIVCSSNYFVNGYVAHKDVPLPQIWPRQGEPPIIEPSKRERLAFFAGAANSPVRKQLVAAWKGDGEIFAHAGRLKTPYSTEFLKSKYCFHVKGFEVNTARIGDALYYGCVPVILADYYDLPFNDVLNWRGFSVVVATADIAFMKKILKGIGFEEYTVLQRNVMEVRKHFQWHSMPVDFDAFYITMYELWIRRGSIRVSSL